MLTNAFQFVTITKLLRVDSWNDNAEAILYCAVSSIRHNPIYKPIHSFFFEQFILYLISIKWTTDKKQALIEL